MLRRLRETVLKNLGIKMTSLLLAMAVYAHVYSQQDQSAVLRVPLLVEGLPAGLTYRGELPPTLRVRVRGRGAELIRLRTQSPRIVIHVTQSSPGFFQRPVTRGDVELPPESDATVESVVDPLLVQLAIEPMATACLPVMVSVRGTPAAGTVRYGVARAWPETLTVFGPSSLISRMDSVRTEEIDLAGRSETVGETVRLGYPQGVRGRTDHVTVRIPLAPLLRRTLGPLRVLLPPELRATWGVEPESAQVRLSGPRSLVESMASSDLRLRAVPSAPAGTDVMAAVEVELPAAFRNDLRVEAVDPSTVTMVPGVR